MCDICPDQTRLWQDYAKSLQKQNTDARVSLWLLLLSHSRPAIWRDRSELDIWPGNRPYAVIDWFILTRDFHSDHVHSRCCWPRGGGVSAGGALWHCTMSRLVLQQTIRRYPVCSRKNKISGDSDQIPLVRVLVLQDIYYINLRVVLDESFADWSVFSLWHLTMYIFCHVLDKIYVMKDQ